MTQPAPPGWYPDPWRAAPLRWWDGAQWSPFTAPRTLPDQFARPRADAATPFASEDRVWRLARAGVWVWLGVQLAQCAVLLAIMPSFASQFRTYLRTSHPVNSTPPALPAGFAWVYALDVVVMAAGVAFLIWQYSAADTARQLGYPSRRSPGLGVGAWFIPIVNLWWPYQALSDCLPPGHPARGSAIYSWLGYVFAGLFVSAGVLTDFFSSVPAGILMAVGLALYATAATIGTRLVRAITADHRRAVGVATTVP
jgi:hypothetical protein